MLLMTEHLHYIKHESCYVMMTHIHLKIMYLTCSIVYILDNRTGMNYVKFNHRAEFLLKPGAIINSFIVKNHAHSIVVSNSTFLSFVVTRYRYIIGVKKFQFSCI